MKRILGDQDVSATVSNVWNPILSHASPNRAGAHSRYMSGFLRVVHSSLGDIAFHHFLLTLA